MAFKALGDLLHSHISKKGLAYQVEASMVLELFNQIAVEYWGATVKGKIRPLYVKDQTLTIAALEPAIVTEIRLYEAQIIEALNKKIGREAVHRIRLLS